MENMKIGKSLIKTVVAIAKGNYDLVSISKHTKLVKSWIPNLITQLINLGLCKKIRKGFSVKYYMSDSSLAQKFIKFINMEPQFDFEQYLSGLNLRILMFCTFSPKTSKIIAKNLNTSVKAIQNRISLMQRIGLLTRDNHNLIIVNEKMYSSLIEFLKEFRMFCIKNANILWKFEDKVLFEVRDEKYLEGVLTGFCLYPHLKIPLYLNVFACYLPKKKLSKEEIFIHSILQIDHTRLVLLALTFYLKHRLNKKKLQDLAIEYDCIERLKDLDRLLKQEKTTELSFIKEKEIKEFLKEYDVEWKMKNGKS